MVMFFSSITIFICAYFGKAIYLNNSCFEMFFSLCDY